MVAELQVEPESGPPSFFSGGGVAGETARAVDWARTPLGPVERWPRSLKTTVGTLLHSRHPMFLWWGPELIQFYNDGYLPSFGKGKHPQAMGQRGRECWPEIWSLIGPQIDDVMTEGRASWNEDQLVPIFRNGRIEEVYWTYGYSPVFDDDGRIGGTLVVCTETTGRVLLDARQRRLRRLADATALTTESDAVLSAVTGSLAAPTHDVCFVLTYRAEPSPRLLAHAGLTDAAVTAMDAAMRAAATAVAEVGLIEVDVGEGLLDRPWPEAVRQAFVARLAPSRTGPGAWMVFGLSPRLPFDAPYREHLTQIVEHAGLAQGRAEAFHMRAAVESERRNLLLQAPVATALITGPDHLFELANPLYCEMVGRKDLVGKSYAQAFPELRDTELPGILDRVYRTGEPFVTDELQVPLPRGDGSREDRFFKFNLEPMRDASGAIYGMMAVAVEVTEQVRARRILEKANEDRDLLLVELAAANRAKDDFLAILGHELRNPLAPIVTALQLMKLRDGRASKEQDVIERQVRHLLRLVDDLLDVSRITRGKVELRQEPLEIAEPIAKAVEITGPELEQRRHELVLEVPREGLCCLGDADRLAQVFVNLLTNAARYTPQGSRIAIAARRDGEHLEVTVRDNGPGIPAELLPRIFDAFVQGRRGADRQQGGLGLGLTVVRTLVSLHGGAVRVHSDAQGSEFVVRLPSTALRARQSAPPPAHLLPAAGRKRVLVVDDNVDAAQTLGEILRAAGNEVVVVHDPVSALEAAGRLRPQVAILDIGLPVMDGYELAARLREQPAGAGCHLLALTGYGQETDRARSARAGFDGHFVKPVEADVLIAAIAKSS